MTIASSRDGGLRVRMNDQGTPLEIHIDQRRLRCDPQVLAADIVRLCREGAAAAGERRLAQLRRSGVPEQVLDTMRSALVPATGPGPAGSDPLAPGPAGPDPFAPGRAAPDRPDRWMRRG